MASVFVTNIETVCAQAIATELLARGYSVHCGVTKSGKAAAKGFSKIAFHEFDPDDPDTVGVMATRVLRHSDPLDGVIFMPEQGVYGSIEEAGAADVRALFARHILMTSMLLQSFLPVVRSNQRGSFIFVGRKFSSAFTAITGWMRACNAAQMEVMRALKDEFAETEVRVALKETQLDAECFDAIDRVLTDTSGHSIFYRNMIEEQRRTLADANEGALTCDSLATDVCNELPLPEQQGQSPTHPTQMNRPQEQMKDLLALFQKWRRR
ncbi:MAG: hypothetical protein ACPIEU_05740 [Candidatus Puniceispirillaceae bacterium]